MKLIAQVKLQPTPEQADAFKRTIETVNAACNYLSERAWETKTFSQYHLHKLAYYDVRKRFGLSAQATVRAIAKVADAYKIDKKTKRTFKPLGAITCDERLLSWKTRDKQEVSIWSVDGRLRIPFVCGEHQRKMLENRLGQADLVYRDGMFFLHQACEIETPESNNPDGWLGVDLGIVNIAFDSDGQCYSGSHLNGLRKRYAKLRAKLQSKGTRSAKRLLKKRRRKESRFASDVNHCIAKNLVEKAKDTGRGIALEDLTGIRSRTNVRKSQRRQHHSWAFSDLRQKIEYKAALSGVPIFLLNL
jgi:IS605 OrfB family transposase